MRNFLKQPVEATTLRLAGTYLAIIMLMSIGFSVVFYNTSSQQLGRQIPPNSVFNNNYGQNSGSANVTSNKENGQAPQLNQFFEERAQEGRDALFARLLILNALALLAGSAISYVLARKTLEPIEAAMEAQSQFVSDASHELRTPLTAIQASNDVALRNKSLTLTQAKQVINDNTAEAVKLQQLANALLNLARQDSQAVITSEVSLQDVTSDAMNQVLQLGVSKGITVEDDVSDIRVLGQSQALAQTLVILLDNAIKYSHKNGTIYISAHKRGHAAYITVRDEGIGIRASDVSHVFRRFYRADSARSFDTERGGYGLGLAIAQKLVEQQAGSISVSSELGKGSSFTIKLPTT